MNNAEKTFGNRKPVFRVMETTLMQIEEHKEFQVEVSSQRETKQKLWDAILIVPDKDIESCENLKNQSTKKRMLVDYLGIDEVAANQDQHNTKWFPFSERSETMRELTDERMIHGDARVAEICLIRKVQCRLCEVFYPKEHCLKFHIRTHTNGKPYICQLEGCNKAFTRPGSLSEHQRRTHERAHSHGCPMCEKVFSCQSDLKNHLRLGDHKQISRMC